MCVIHLFAAGAAVVAAKARQAPLCFSGSGGGVLTIRAGHAVQFHRLADCVPVVPHDRCDAPQRCKQALQHKLYLIRV
jgi:hypothetical protein